MNTEQFYVDASIIAGLVLGDIDVDPILALVSEETVLGYSRFGFGEAASAISARVRATEAGDDEAERQIEALSSYLGSWKLVRWTARDLDRAITLTARASLALKLPDAIHVAIAERLGLPLLTTDRQQWRAARTLGIAAEMPLLPKATS